MSLDNRTRRLVVKGLNADDDRALAKLEEWYKVRTRPRSILLARPYVTRCVSPLVESLNPSK